MKMNVLESPERYQYPTVHVERVVYRVLYSILTGYCDLRSMP